MNISVSTHRDPETRRALKPRVTPTGQRGRRRPHRRWRGRRLWRWPVTRRESRACPSRRPRERYEGKLQGYVLTTNKFLYVPFLESIPVGHLETHKSSPGEAGRMFLPELKVLKAIQAQIVGERSCLASLEVPLGFSGPSEIGARNGGYNWLPKSASFRCSNILGKY